MQFAYYPGCSLKQTSSLLDKQTRVVFESLGIQLKEIKDWNCCGATSASKVNKYLEVGMPARNIGIAESENFSEMIIPCSACYLKTALAKSKLEEDSGLKESINTELKHKVQGQLKITSILEPLFEMAQSGQLAEKVERKLSGIYAVSYYGCMLTRFPKDIPIQDNIENPKYMDTILESIGCNSLDWNCKTYCCGASAAMYDYETSTNLMAKIYKDAISRGANCFVTTCPFCQMNLDSYQNHILEKSNISYRIPVYFITELVGRALGLSIEDLQIDRHFIEATTLIKEAEINEGDNE
ncbi:MAG: CoB--CoM heterodisulfide reductase iron-sulfur subunit B family protein [Desulfohalobiaceae bacterium]